MSFVRLVAEYGLSGTRSVGGGYTYIDGKKCSYLHPDEVLREVMKWKDFIEFIEKECKAEVWWQIPIAYILNDGEFQDKLLNAAHKWVTERKVAR